MKRFASFGNGRDNPDARRGERGLTLIELIASLTLMSVVLGVIYASITFGVNAYHKVGIENKLRDEGDLIMSSIISELYRMGPERIAQSSADKDHAIALVMPKIGDEAPEEEMIAFRPNADCKNALFIGNRADVDRLQAEIATESSIVLPETELDERCRADQTADPAAGDGVSSIKLDCFGSPTAQGCGSGLIEIRLKLRQTYGGKDYDMDLESKFGF
ncbi:PilW family protein [Paenibacillus glycinis]|uniref:Prepilin-type N-terminal cleavage/methylation domain-containing protein n=1 Tax=Paenibacillus glycinis TaxID=2697035 RepID=A0ABW9XRR5_9BACL|nr:prepilin-type N-terminal cleavage/methylation domain-containing protein [Paenibacillus glycinis]NBD25352.1 prepilin-type N-terminal cleavage/methylation domain-containing protein [Paenibacillus glycinis]